MSPSLARRSHRAAAALAVSLACGLLPVATHAGATDALLAVESNRASIVESVVARFGEQVEALGFSSAALREQLMGLRADQLLAASLVRDLTSLNLRPMESPDALQRYVAVEPTALREGTANAAALAYVVRIDGALKVVSPVELAALRGGQARDDQLVGYFVDARAVAVLSESGLRLKDGSGTGPQSWIGYTAGNNQATAQGSAVMAGLNNTASGPVSAVISGAGNVASGQGALIGGGDLHQAQGNYSVIVGGYGNKTTAADAVIVGGAFNENAGQRSLLGAGARNRIAPEASYSFIGGGGRDTNVGTGVAGSNALDNVAYSKWTFIGGGYGNVAGSSSVPSSARLAAVAAGSRNAATNDSAFVGGGSCNVASGKSAVVAGGGTQASVDCFDDVALRPRGNSAVGDASAIGGGESNVAFGNYGAVAGGRRNSASGIYASVGGGDGNIASALFARIGGGQSNTASAEGATVAGGKSNLASSSEASVGGGLGNVASGLQSAVGGGAGNQAQALVSVVGGGLGNYATEVASTVGGGFQNAAAGPYSSVLGGIENIANGGYSAVLGGAANVAGGSFSVAAGRRAKTHEDGMFMFADSQPFDFNLATFRGAGFARDSFNVRATGPFGVYFVTQVNGSGFPTYSCYLTPGSAWVCSSDRNVKKNLLRLDGREVLRRLVSMPVFQWQPKEGINAGVRHYGPTAQDFFRTFGLGNDDKGINSQDADGVALAAIQGLAAENRALRHRLDASERALADERARRELELRELRAELRALAQRRDSRAP